MTLRELRPDPYILGILAAVAAAALLPVSGAAVAPFKLFTQAAVALLFFLYGVRLSREAVLAGIANWRLHILALSVTFIAFPLVGLAFSGLLDRLLTSPLMLAIGKSELSYYFPKSDRLAHARLTELAAIETLETAQH